MFLNELKDRLDEVQAERGNVLLSRAHVMHGHAVLIAHSDMPGMTSDIEVLLGIPVEDRLRRADAPDAVLPITANELLQLLEFKAEALKPQTGQPPQVDAGVSNLTASAITEGTIVAEPPKG